MTHAILPLPFATPGSRLLCVAALLFGSFGAFAQASPATQDFNSSTSGTAATQLRFAGDGSGNYFTMAGGSGTGAYGVKKGNNGNNTFLTTTIDFIERTFAAGSGTATANKLTFDLANPVSTFDDLSKVEVYLNINQAGFPATPQLSITPATSGGVTAAYAFSASGATTYLSSYATNTALTMDATTYYKQLTITLPSSTTTGTRVAVQIKLTSGTKTANALLIDNVALTSGNATPLPVELTRFDATAGATGVGLTWATATEKNSDRFEIERSPAGREYTTIGAVKSQGSTASAREYTFVDSHPLAGTAYYRLRQVDADGAVAYSPVAVVKGPARTEALAFPNPSEGQLTLAADLGLVTYRAYNNLGQTILHGQASGGERLNVAGLPKGPFFLELTGATGRTTQRLVRE